MKQDGNQYRALFKNQAGEVTSEAATLTVHSPPAITLEPSNATVLVGESAVFEATASGSPTPTQQWEVSTNGGSTWSTIEGATSNQLTIANTTTSQSGNEYRAAFTNVGGTTFSQAATLTVATNKFSAVAWGQKLVDFRASVAADAIRKAVAGLPRDRSANVQPTSGD